MPGPVTPLPAVANGAVSLPVDAGRARARVWPLGKALVALTKPRLAFFSILTAMAAYAASAPPARTSHALLALVGIAFAAGGALAFNQWWERALDARMRRTRNRPLPCHQVPAAAALAWSVSLAAGGVGVLALWINPVAAGVALTTILGYGLIYTPLKRRTRWATEIGAVTGALPPLLGSAAAGEALAAPGWILAGILFLWQMPHFFAIGWTYRDDYRAAGFALLPAVDATGGFRTGVWSLAYTIALIPVSVLPWAMSLAGAIFGVAAVTGGAAMVWRAWQFATDPRERNRDRAARRLFVASIAYLPWIVGALIVDRLV